MRSTKALALTRQVTASAAVIIFILLQAGCTGPRARLGYLPTATFGVAFADPDNLGSHSYNYSIFESGGIMYTCDAGHLDIDHIRGNADLTRYIVERLRKILADKKENFSFSLAGERSVHYIKLKYPDNWDCIKNNQAAIDEIAFGAGPYFVYSATVWHEFLTWFGVHFIGFEPEFNSAFSWEDNYSNVLGINLGIESLKDTQLGFDDSMTLLLNRTLKQLKVQTRQTAITASNSVRGEWYTGNLIPDTKMRNFDIGLDGMITPTLIKGVAKCSDPEPLSIKVPTLDVLKKYGFEFSYEIEPNVFEQGLIYKAAGEKHIYPLKHYPILLQFVKDQAREKGYMYDE